MYFIWTIPAMAWLLRKLNGEQMTPVNVWQTEKYIQT